MANKTENAMKTARFGKVLSETRGLFEEAMKSLETEYQYVDAARVAKFLGLSEKSMDLYLKELKQNEESKTYHFAAKIAREAGLEEKAEAYEQITRILHKF